MSLTQTPMVILQFRCKEECIPHSIQLRTKDVNHTKSQKRDGVRVIQSAPNVSLESFAEELETAGYQLVSAWHEPLPFDERHVVRFTFMRKELVTGSPDLALERTGLDEMIKSAFWRTEMYANTYRKEGKEVPGKQIYCLNLDSRISRYLPTGEPVVAWLKDDEGQKVGESPLPLTPRFYLHAVDDIKLVM